MAFFEILYIAFCFGVLFFLILPFVNVLLSFFNKEKYEIMDDPTDHDFGIIITAYKNADIAKGLVRSLIGQSCDRFRIYLIADNCDLSKWDIRHEKLDVLRPENPLNLKAKSIILGIEKFKRSHDYVVVFDADNLAHPEFLKIINDYVNRGFMAVQGQRTAKNLDTAYARADATGEFYKNYIERYVPYLIGSSSVISGSGMAVEADLFKAFLNSPEIETGKHFWKKMLQEDKILQNYILRQNGRIAYAKDAIVYDEKVTTGDAVETQRGRWLFSYFQNLPNSIGIFRRGIAKLSWNQFLFGLITLAPPMFIQLFGAVILGTIGLFFMPEMSIVLAFGILIFVGNIFLTLYLSKAPKAVWRAIWVIPLFVGKQVLALFKMGNPNKHFKHTEHNRNISIEEVLEKK